MIIMRWTWIETFFNHGREFWIISQKIVYSHSCMGEGWIEYHIPSTSVYISFLFLNQVIYLPTFKKAFHVLIC